MRNTHPLVVIRETDVGGFSEFMILTSASILALVVFSTREVSVQKWPTIGAFVVVSEPLRTLN